MAFTGTSNVCCVVNDKIKALPSQQNNMTQSKMSFRKFTQHVDKPQIQVMLEMLVHVTVQSI